MNYREMIVSDFRERVFLNSEIPSELKSALKYNERVPLFIDNLNAEINKIVNSRKTFKLDRYKLKMIVYDLTDMFCMAVKSEAENRYKSDLEKSLQAKPDYGLDKFGNGFNEELGVEIRDRTKTWQEAD